MYLRLGILLLSLQLIYYAATFNPSKTASAPSPPPEQSDY